MIQQYKRKQRNFMNTNGEKKHTKKDEKMKKNLDELMRKT